jgi:molybdopterin molybdotransferase
MDCFTPKLLPLSDALYNIKKTIKPRQSTELVSINAALDRILSEPLYSHINVPGYDNAAMDGYAFCCDSVDTHTSLTLVGHSLAGHPFSGAINTGECVRIMTGAVIPAGADTVIMQENTSSNHEHITLLQTPTRGENIRHAGDDIAINALVFEQGRRITPIDIGLLASLGISHINVFTRLKIAVISTGDELKALGQPLLAGEIYDSNRPALIALLSRLAVEVIDMGCVGDNVSALTEAFNSAIEQADAVIASGGVSVGDADYTKDVLQTRGQIHFWKVAIKPGKPFAFGLLQHTQNSTKPCWFFGLPGNPVSSVITYHQLVVPALRYLAGENNADSPSFMLPTKSALKKQPGRVDFQRGNVTESNGETCVTSTGNQSSGALSSMAKANSYIVLEQEQGAVQAGDKVKVILFDRFIQ